MERLGNLLRDTQWQTTLEVWSALLQEPFFLLLFSTLGDKQMHIPR